MLEMLDWILADVPSSYPSPSPVRAPRNVPVWLRVSAFLLALYTPLLVEAIGDVGFAVQSVLLFPAWPVVLVFTNVWWSVAISATGQWGEFPSSTLTLLVGVTSLITVVGLLTTFCRGVRGVLLATACLFLYTAGSLVMLRVILSGLYSNM